MSVSKAALLGIRLGIAIGAMTGLTACVHHHHDDYPHEVYVDDHGWRHEGYYDEHHGWHGGYVDERGDRHDDPGDWHH